MRDRSQRETWEITPTRAKFTMSSKSLKKGQLIGWKFRAALVLGTVDHSEGDTVFAHALNPATRASTVTRRREKVLTEAELDPADISTAKSRGGHMARRDTHSRSAKAMAMGLSQPTLMMTGGKAKEERKKRNRAYELEEDSEAGAHKRSKRSKKA